METEIDKKTEVKETVENPVQTAVKDFKNASVDKRPPRDFKKNTRRPARRESRVKPEFDQKIINIRRVARVVTGGRRFSFSVAIVAGNRKGMVGVGLGKAGDTSLAIEKAFNDARKNMVAINLTKEMSVPHEVSAKYSSSRVTIMPAADRGIIAGSSMRTVLEMAGVKDVGGKVRSGSKNKLNIARAAVVALSMLSKPKERTAVKVSNDTIGAVLNGVSGEVSNETNMKTIA